MNTPAKILTATSILEDLWELAAKEESLSGHIQNLYVNLAQADDPDWIVLKGPRVPQIHRFHGEDAYRDGCREIRSICQILSDLTAFTENMLAGHYRENLRNLIKDCSLEQWYSRLEEAAGEWERHEDAT